MPRVRQSAQVQATVRWPQADGGMVGGLALAAAQDDALEAAAGQGLPGVGREAAGPAQTTGLDGEAGAAQRVDILLVHDGLLWKESTCVGWYEVVKVR